MNYYNPNSQGEHVLFQKMFSHEHNSWRNMSRELKQTARHKEKNHSTYGRAAGKLRSSINLLPTSNTAELRLISCSTENWAAPVYYGAKIFHFIRFRRQLEYFGTLESALACISRVSLIFFGPSTMPLLRCRIVII